MIFARVADTASRGKLEPGVQEAIDFALSHDLASFENGSHPIDGDRLFVNIVSYETKTPKERFWEAHKDYLDVHVPLVGTEQIDLNFLENLEKGEYEKAGDFQPAFGDKMASVVMNPGDFLVCYPNDAHRTAIKVGDQPETIKKAIFKVRID